MRKTQGRRERTAVQLAPGTALRTDQILNRNLPAQIARLQDLALSS
jgi:hypothetical protein